MIPRYSRPNMTAIWNTENKFKIWLEIETLACEKMADLGTIPQSVPKTMREKGGFDIPRIEEIEQDVKHDVIAFLTNLGEYVGEDSRYIHQGMTSSDLIDTGFAVQLSQASDILLADLDLLLNALKKRIEEHRHTICMGRSHGIHAEPTTFGLKLAGHYCAFKRAKERLENAKKDISVCALSGAVGTYATLDPRIESYVADKMGLTCEEVSTQIIPRDRHAMFFATLGVIASSIENFVTEIRHLQRSEVLEVQEYFSKGQKGSSAMPHKKNPILSENLTGLARIVRSAVTPAMENVTLWHERDISHSSVERMIAPDTTVTLDFALHRLTGLIEKLLIYPDTMKANLEKMGGVIFSQRALLALIQKGLSREEAYTIVQRNAMKVWDCQAKTSFKDFLATDSEVTNVISQDDFNDLFNYRDYTYRIDHIIDRALK